MKSYSYNENIVALYRGRSNQESQFLKIKAETMLPEFGVFFTHSRACFSFLFCFYLFIY